MFEAFQNGISLGDISNIKQGLITANNNRFLRQWFEVEYHNINFNCSCCEDTKNHFFKWVPQNKGGNYRKWYGNKDFIVNWLNDGFEIRNFKDKNGKIKSRPQNAHFYFKESLSWSKISSSVTSFRYFSNGFIPNVAAGFISLSEKYKYYVLGYLNSNISSQILRLISPTLNYNEGHIEAIPIIFNESFENEIGIYLLIQF